MDARSRFMRPACTCTSLPSCACSDPWFGSSADVVGRFIDVMLVQRRLSLTTCAHYRGTLLRLDRWLQRFEHCTLVTADENQLARYLASWARRRTSLGRLSRVLLSMRRFYAYLCDSHARNDNPMLSSIVTRWHQRQRPKTATKRLQRESRQAATERDRVMLALMIATELHVPQLLALRMTDLHLERGHLSLRDQDGTVSVPLSPALVGMLQRFVHGSRGALLKGRESAHVFPSTAGRAMTEQEFWRACHREAAFAEEPGGSGRLGGWRSRRGALELPYRQGA
jgi:integrase/recombinase XerD